MAQKTTSKPEYSKSTANLGIEAHSVSLCIASAGLHYFMHDFTTQRDQRDNAFHRREASQRGLSGMKDCCGASHRHNNLLFSQAEAHRTQSRTISTLREALLPKLLWGDFIKVKVNIEKESAE